MRTQAYFFTVIALVWGGADAATPPVPSDIAVTLTATPSTGLNPGDPIEFALSVTNLGPMPVHALVIDSSLFYDQIYIQHGSIDCPLILSVLDYPTTFAYFYSWYPTDFLSGNGTDLAVGGTRTCHFQMALTSQAPSAYTFGFGVPDYFADINPANDNANVVLQRAPAPAAVPIPSLSAAMLALLAGLLVMVASLSIASERR